METKNYFFLLAILISFTTFSQDNFPPENYWNRAYRLPFICDSISFYERENGNWVLNPHSYVDRNEEGLISRYAIAGNEGFRYFYNNHNQITEVQYYLYTPGKISGNRSWTYTWEGDKVAVERHYGYLHDNRYYYTYEGDKLVKIIREDLIPDHETLVLNISYLYEDDMLVERIDSVFNNQLNAWQLDRKFTYSYSNDRLATITTQDYEELFFYDNDLVDSIRIYGTEKIIFPGGNSEGLLRDITTSNYYDAFGNLKEQVVLRLMLGSQKIDTSRTVCEDAPVITSVAKTTKENTVVAYPNPASSQVHFTIDNREVELFTVYDLNGKTALTVVPESNTIDVSSLEPGLYTVRITTKNGSSKMSKLRVVR